MRWISIGVVGLIACKGGDDRAREAKRVTTAFERARPTFVTAVPRYEAIGKAAAAQDTTALPRPELTSTLDFRVYEGEGDGFRPPNKQRNAAFIVLEELDPAYEVPEHQPPFLHVDLRRARGWLASPPALPPAARDAKTAADLWVRDVEMTAASLANVDVLVVVKTIEREAPMAGTTAFSPGRLRQAALVYQVEDARLLGGIVYESSIEAPSVQGSGETDLKASEALRDQLERALDSSARPELVKQLSAITKVMVDE
jgi:hypothetical protein